MQTLVADALLCPTIRALSVQILRVYGLPTCCSFGNAEAIYEWIQSHVGYLPDPIGLELVQSPEITIQQQAGDCDDLSVLFAALAMSVGLPVRLVVVGPSPEALEHVYPEVYVDGEWVGADLTVGGTFPTDAPADQTREIYQFNDVEAFMERDAGLRRYIYSGGGGVDHTDFTRAVHDAMYDAFRSLWRDGQIDMADLQQSVALLDAGDTPFAGVPTIEVPARQAVLDFISYVESAGLRSYKTARTLEGLSGFWKSVWDGVKGLFGGKDGEPTTIVIQPPVTTAPAAAPVLGLFSNPLVIVGMVLVGIMLIKSK